MKFEALKDLVTEIAKRYKTVWVANDDQGDIPPIVIVIKDGKPYVAITAPQVDKNRGLQAASMARLGFGAEELILICDAHVTLTSGKSEEEQNRIRDKYSEPGSMQKACDEQEACSHGEICDCITIQHITSEYKFNSWTLCYEYHGKGGPEFKWLEEHNQEMLNAVILSEEELDQKIKNREEDEQQYVGGLIPEGLKNALLLPKPEENEAFAAAANIFEVSSEEALRAPERMARRMLKDEGFFVQDLIQISADKDPIQTIKERCSNL